MARYETIEIDPLTMSGTELADYLNDTFDAMESNHLGSGNPDYMVSGMTFFDDATPTLWSYRVGLDDTTAVELFKVDTANERPVFDIANLSVTDADEGDLIGFDGDEWVPVALVGLSCADGNATTPSIDSINFPGNGIFFPADDTLGIAINSAEFARFTETGLGIGTNDPAAALHITRDGPIDVRVSRASTNTSGPLFSGYKVRNTHASPSAVVDNDILAAFAGFGYHTTGTPGYTLAAFISMRVDGSPSGNFVPGDIAFFTGTDAASTSERMTIRASGAIEMISGSASIGVNDTTAALLSLFGDNGTQGARQRWYHAASEDTGIDYWQAEADLVGGQHILLLGPDTDPDMFGFNGTLGVLGALNGYLAGVSGTTRGQYIAYRGTSTNSPGVLVLEARSGTEYYFWVTDAGQLRRHTALPTADTDGSAV